MNPTLLKDLILAGHRVACKRNDWDRAVFLFIKWDWKFQSTILASSIKKSLDSWLCWWSWSESQFKENFAWEYKIVTPLPQLPQVWDTVEVLEICRELPRFDKSLEELIGSKHRVKEVDDNWDIGLANWFYFTSRQVAKCEPEKEQSIQSEEQFWEIIELIGYIYS